MGQLFKILTILIAATVIIKTLIITVLAMDLLIIIITFPTLVLNKKIVL